MKIIIPALACALMLSLAACTAPPAPPAIPAPSSASAETPMPKPKQLPPVAGPVVPKRSAPVLASGTSDFEVELERRGCFGRCPSYRVSLSADGQVRFFGERHVGSLGEHQAQVAVETVAALRAELQREPYASLNGRYTPSDPRCGSAATDMASVSMSIREADVTRNIDHYLGCSQAPASLRALAKAIDDVSGSARWIDAPTE